MAGLATARARGRLGGAKKKTTKNQDDGMRALWERGDLTAAELAKQFGISVPTFFRRVELPVGSHLRITAGASRVASGPCFHTCRRQYPGRADGTDSLILSHQLRPSLDYWRVGSCIPGFGACTALTFITACMIAKSPLRPSTPEASAVSFPPLLPRLLQGGTTQFPGGILTHCGPAPFTAHQLTV